MSFSALFADEAIQDRFVFEGNIDYFMTGTPLARDTNGDRKVDALISPARISVADTSIPKDATLSKSYLYWGGTREQKAEECKAGGADEKISLTTPGGIV